MEESGGKSSGYVLHRGKAEYERLAAQARVWEPATREALQQTGLSAGMSALDVGCGTGAVMRLLADLVGPTGRVTGVDNDETVGEEGVGRLRSEGPDIFSFIQADLENMPQIKGAPFDLVFARLLVIHMPDPLKTLRHLWDWVKPGGTLLVMDYDMSASRAIPSNAIVDRAIELMREIFKRTGKDIEIGTRMPTLFVEAGIGMPDRCVIAGLVVAELGGAGMLRAVLTSLRNAAIQHGIADARTMNEVDVQLSHLPPGVFRRWSDLVATQRRKCK